MLLFVLNYPVLYSTLKIKGWTKANLFISFFQIDQNAREDFNLTSDGEFNAIKSLVLGRVHGEWGHSKRRQNVFLVREHSDSHLFDNSSEKFGAWLSAWAFLDKLTVIHGARAVSWTKGYFHLSTECSEMLSQEVNKRYFK